MSINVFKDDACTLPVKSPQKFTMSDSVSPYTAYTLNPAILSGAQLEHLYKWNGTSHIKLVSGVDYSLSGNSITLVAGLTSPDVLIAVPKDRLNLNFGGVFGATKTSSSFLILKRDSAYAYDSLLLMSEDLDIQPQLLTIVDEAIVATPNQSMLDAGSNTVQGSKLTGTSITGLTTNALIGQAVILNNVYRGKVIANSVNAILINNTTYTYAGASTDDLVVVSTGNMLFALDGGNNQAPIDSAFAQVISLPNLEVGRDQIKVWFKDSLTIPSTATNFPNTGIKLTGIEYVI